MKSIADVAVAVLLLPVARVVCSTWNPCCVVMVMVMEMMVLVLVLV